MTTPSASSARGWVVVCTALSINLVLGVLYAWSVIGKQLRNQWNWTQTEAALPFAVGTGSFAITMIFAGRAQDRLGPRWVATLGGVLLGLGMIASAYARSPWMMMATFGVLGGIGIGLGYSATTPPSIKWFPPARKGLITGLVVSGVGLAAVYISPLTEWLLGPKRDQIPFAFLVLGVGTIVVVATLAQLLTNPPAGYQPATAPGAANRPAAIARRDYDWREMLNTPQFYLLWATFILAAAAGLMLISNAASIADVQAKWKAGFYLVMILALFNTAGRVISGYVSDSLGRTNTMMLAFLLQAANMFAFSYYTTPLTLGCGVAFAGLCYGTIFTLFPAATADFYGLRNLGVNYGLLFTGFGVAGATGAILGGRVRDLFGSFSLAYKIAGVMLLVAAVLALITRAPKATADVAPAPTAAR